MLVNLTLFVLAFIQKKLQTVFVPLVDGRFTSNSKTFAWQLLFSM